MVIQKEFYENVNVEKNQQMQNYPVGKELTHTARPLWSYYYGNLGFVTYFGVKVTFSSCSISSFNHR